MRRLDWLQVVGWYAFGVAIARVLGVASGSAPFGGPLGTGVVIVPAMAAANVLIRPHGPARPLPWRLLAIGVVVIASLQAVVLAVGQATVGWQGGWRDNVAFAAFSAVVYPVVVASFHRRQAGSSGPASPGTTLPAGR